ncbi:MAG: phosphoenolpyruvate carboxylase, partial [Microcoleus sp. C1-bin4]|nr:phosphoenolpyruvate carboxylase [Microcoleus sp. C1-bin4]
VLLLAKEAGLYDPGTSKGSIQVVPLFETVEDLQRAPTVMKKLFELPQIFGLTHLKSLFGHFCQYSR